MSEKSILNVVFPALVPVAIALAAVALGGYEQYVLTLTIIAAIVGVALVLVVGYARVVTLASAAFVAIGAYTTTIFAQKSGADYSLALALGVIFAGFAGLALGIVAIRFQGHGLALLTIAFQSVIIIIVREARELTGGASGLKVGSVYLGQAEALADSILLVIFGGIVASLTVLGLTIALKSWFGANLRASSANPVAAEAFGIDPRWYRIAAFGISSAALGVAGGLIAPHLRIIDPESFGISWSILMLAYPIVGGVTSVWGGLFGGVGLRILPEVLRFLGEYHVLVTCLLVVVVLRFDAGGTAGIIGKFFRPRKVSDAAQRSAVRPPQPVVPINAITPALTQPIALKLSNISKSFDAVQAVRDVSLEFTAGKIHGIIGPNGAGKTTLFNMLCGAVTPDNGTIELFGTRIDREPARLRLERGLTRTFQNIGLFSQLTCIENVRIGLGENSVLTTLFRSPLQVFGMGRAPVAYQKALEALRLVGLEEFAGQPADQLSLGAQRRLEIARAIVSTPRLLLLDEPVAGIPVEQHEDIAVLLRNLNQSFAITIVVIEHNIGFVRSISDTLTVLALGEVAASGSPDKVLARPDIRKVYFGEAA